MIDFSVSEAHEETQQGSTSPLEVVGDVWPKRKKKKMPDHAMILLLAIGDGNLLLDGWIGMVNRQCNMNQVLREHGTCQKPEYCGMKMKCCDVCDVRVWVTAYISLPLL